MNRYKQLVTQIGELNAQVTAIFDKAGDEPLDAATKGSVIDTNKKIEELELEVQEILAQQELKNGAQARAAEYNKPADGQRLGAPQGKSRERVEVARSLGEMVTDNPEFKSWMERITRNGHIPQRTNIQSPPIEVAGLKALITGVSATSAGALVSNDRLSIIDAGTFGRPLTLRDLVTNGTTGSDTVEYVRQGTHTNAAATVAEATATGDGTGAKPESSMALSVVTENVKTIAHWVAATNRALADAGQLRTLIDSFLRYGLEEELEDQMMNGDGAGENFTGILNTSGTGTQAYDTSLLTTTRKARTKVMTEGNARATAYVMNPLDWEAMDLLQDGENRYYFGGPMVMGTPRLWGLPVVESEAIAQGTAIVADWRLAALWDREQASITTSNSHSDFFVRNLVAILAELRAAFGVIRPAAFIEIDMAA
jgi:HK97 family phage major capsid protein